MTSNAARIKLVPRLDDGGFHAKLTTMSALVQPTQSSSEERGEDQPAPPPIRGHFIRTVVGVPHIFAVAPQDRSSSAGANRNKKDGERDHAV